MPIARVTADGLLVAARQLDHHAQDIMGNRKPNDENPPNQATAAVVSATDVRIAAISALLASRIEATAKKLDAAGHRYADTEDVSATALAE
jgi:flagellar hook-length control protein FliK